MYLDAALQNIERMPQSTFDEIVEKYVEMTIAHPSGRATAQYADLAGWMLKKALGQVVDWSHIDKEDYPCRLWSAARSRIWKSRRC